jgi:inorganic triphosphatase YgiF
VPADPREPSSSAPRDGEAGPAPPFGDPQRAGAPRALRLALAADDAPRLRRHPLLAALGEQRRATRSALHQVYWDTPGLDLAAAGLALRVHQAGRQRVQTVETPIGVGLAGAVRGEHHALLPGDRPDLALVPDPDCRARLEAAAGTAPLAPVFEVHLDRTRRVLEEDGGTLLFGLEVGEIRSAWGVLPVCDVELGSRGGDPGRPYRLAVELLDDVRLRPLSRSVAERAAERITGRGPAIRKARPVEVPAAALLDELLAAVAESGLAQLVENEPAASLGLDPEGVHQLRVGARRLRSALGFFAPVLPERARGALRAELRWLAGELGPARDLDVFVVEGLDPLVAARPGDEALACLRAAAEDARTAAHARVRDALTGPRWPRLALETGGWIARRAWREQTLTPSSAQLFRPAQAYAAEVLERRHRRARKLGRRLAEASPPDRHRLRVQLKKLRYAAEFTACLHPGRRAERYAKRLARLQDLLGHLNDVANAERQLAALLPRLDAAAPAGAARAAGFVDGWLAHSAHAAAARLPERWERFEDAPRPWRR